MWSEFYLMRAFTCLPVYIIPISLIESLHTLYIMILFYTIPSILNTHTVYDAFAARASIFACSPSNQPLEYPLSTNSVSLLILRSPFPDVSSTNSTNTAYSFAYGVPKTERPLDFAWMTTFSGDSIRSSTST